MTQQTERCTDEICLLSVTLILTNQCKKGCHVRVIHTQNPSCLGQAPRLIKTSHFWLHPYWTSLFGLGLHSFGCTSTGLPVQATCPGTKSRHFCPRNLSRHAVQLLDFTFLVTPLLDCTLLVGTALFLVAPLLGSQSKQLVQAPSPLF